MMKLDIDKVTKKVTRFLIALRKPYEIRISPSGRGMHVRSSCPGCPRTGDCYECWLYTMFDDKRRLALCRSNKKHGLCHNILNDVKAGKLASPWVEMRTERDVDRYLRQFTGYY